MVPIHWLCPPHAFTVPPKAVDFGSLEAWEHIGIINNVIDRMLV